MPKNKIVNIGGTKYMVRELTFEELVKLGSENAEVKESKTVVAEVLSRCLIEPKLKHEQITHLPDKALVTLVSEVLDIALALGPPRDLIA
jgi:hypothetical protein